MKPRTIFAYLSIPAAFAVGGFIHALGRESFNWEMFASVLVGGFVFYAAPHLLWVVVIGIAKPSIAVAHSGFIAPTLALASIASFWLLPPDPSGLPMQWMFYWPLAIILLIFSAGSTSVYLLVKDRNKAPTDTPKWHD